MGTSGSACDGGASAYPGRVPGYGASGHGGPGCPRGRPAQPGHGAPGGLPPRARLRHPRHHQGRRDRAAGRGAGDPRGHRGPPVLHHHPA
ncbi:hypothetical protein FY030_11035 [Ornithinimicrobium pratense]|uniref:Uncharacterized protein n=1 Tax=Ornithinimicrobium pratense TaxID=2593973 RepID=A0A5J6V7S6_9MICO|nr:hypothetical protein FY030_11035 [Ornithinimicrobium pratense]